MIVAGCSSWLFCCVPIVRGSGSESSELQDEDIAPDILLWLELGS